MSEIMASEEMKRIAEAIRKAKAECRQNLKNLMVAWANATGSILAARLSSVSAGGAKSERIHILPGGKTDYFVWIGESFISYEEDDAEDEDGEKIPGQSGTVDIDYMTREEMQGFIETFGGAVTRHFERIKAEAWETSQTSEAIGDLVRKLQK